MKNLYLHIGYPKTGTTSIQSFLARNALGLRQLGLLYPETGRLHDAHYMFNFCLGIGQYDNQASLPTPHTLLAELKAEAERSGCDDIVISSEYFVTTMAIRRVQDFFSGYNVKIMIYLRRHDYAFESGFAQSEKTAANPPWDPDIASYTLHAICSGAIPYDYLNVLLRWREVFGKEAILVRPFEKQQNVPDLFADFLAAMGIENSASLIRPGNVNSSLGREALQAIRIIRNLKLSPALTNKALNRLLATNKSAGSERYFSPEMRHIIFRKYAPAYRVIAQEFMGRKDGILFREAEPKTTDPWTPPATPDLESVLYNVLQCLAAVAE